MGIVIAGAGAAPHLLCLWKHGTGVHGAVRRYNQIQSARWKLQVERAKREGKPSPAPLNTKQPPTTF